MARPAAIIWVAAAVLAVAGCGSSEERSPGPTGTVLALLDDGVLVAIDLRSGGGRTEQRRIGRASVRGPGRRLSWDATASTLYAIVAAAGSRFDLVSVDPVSLRVTRRVSLGDAGRFSSLVVGPRSGRLFVFGTRRGDPVVRVVAPDGELIREWRIRKATAPRWDVIDGAVSDDERDVFVSYHGGVDGIDRFSLAAGRLVCDQPNRRGGCLRAHGFLHWHASGLVATTSGEALVLIRPGDPGVERVHTGLRGNHMVNLAFAPDGQLHAAGSCLEHGGYSTASFLGARPRVLVSSGYPEATATGRPCGERLALGGAPLTVALAQRRASAYDDHVSGAVAIVDPATGRVSRTLDMPALPEDLVITPPGDDP